MKISTKRGYTLIELLVVLTIVGIIAAVLFSIILPSRAPANRANCQSNLKQLGLAMIQYTQDYDEKFPPIALHAVASSTNSFAQPYGWADAIQPYAKNTQILQCPSEANITPGEDATQSGFTDYWFNTKLSARNLEKIDGATNLFLAGEGNDGSDGTDARYNRDVLPQRWIDEAESPCWRHRDTGNYLFADGHVKMMRPEQVAQFRFLPPRQKEPIP